MNKFLKFVFEFGPLLVFFFLNFKRISLSIEGFPSDPIFTATAGFILATLVSLVGMYVLMRKIPVMPLVSGIFVLLFGGLTLYLSNDIFIKIKPTLVNLIFAAILFIGLKFNKIFIKVIMEEALNLTEEGWRGMTIRWGFFFLIMAALNEIVWRNFSTDFWATFKVFGTLPITALFILSQVSFISKHMKPLPSEISK